MTLKIGEGLTGLIFYDKMPPYAAKSHAYNLKNIFLEEGEKMKNKLRKEGWGVVLFILFIASGVVYITLRNIDWVEFSAHETTIEQLMANVGKNYGDGIAVKVSGFAEPWPIAYLEKFGEHTYELYRCKMYSYNLSDPVKTRVVSKKSVYSEEGSTIIGIWRHHPSGNFLEVHKSYDHKKMLVGRR